MRFIKVGLGLPERAYTYGYNGAEEIQRDDYVVVPPNSYNPYPSIGRVIRVMETPDFTGLLTVLSQKVSAGVVQVSVQQGNAEPDLPPGWDDVL